MNPVSSTRSRKTQDANAVDFARGHAKALARYRSSTLEFWPLDHKLEQFAMPTTHTTTAMRGAV